MFLVNGEEQSAMGIRARSFATRMSDDFSIGIHYRSRLKGASIVRFLLALCKAQPSVCYVFDMAYSGVLAGILFRSLSRCRLVIDTGDAIVELAKATGRNRIGVMLTWCLEEAGFRFSDHVIVRSHFHQIWLSERGIKTTVIPDGVDLEQFKPMDATDLRREYGLTDSVTIGTLGSLIWNEKTDRCYGLEILHVLRALQDLPVMGVIIGDGSGLEKLKRIAAEYGVVDRVVFLGRIPYNNLPPYLALMDICISTQTNDVPGRVRTTGKLPLYLAMNRHVLATAVGEAALVLPSEMLVSYEGPVDDEYPSRLAQTVRRQVGSSTSNSHTRRLAQQYFDYDVLAASVAGTLSGLRPKTHPSRVC